MRPVRAFNAARDTEMLRSLKSLETINTLPAPEFWKTVDGKVKGP
jgi:hypothetical protein